MRRFSRLCLLSPSARHPIRAIWYRMATGFRACLVKLTPCLFPTPWPSSVPPATRSLAQSDLLIVSSSHRLSSPINRHGGRGGGYCSRLLACRFVSYCGSARPAVYLCGFCGGWRRGLSCLLAYRIMYLVDGGRDKRDGACPAFDCLNAPAHPLSSPSPASTHKRPRVFFFILSLPG